MSGPAGNMGIRHMPRAVKVVDFFSLTHQKYMSQFLY